MTLSTSIFLNMSYLKLKLKEKKKKTIRRKQASLPPEQTQEPDVQSTEEKKVAQTLAATQTRAH